MPAKGIHSGPISAFPLGVAILLTWSHAHPAEGAGGLAPALPFRIKHLAVDASGALIPSPTPLQRTSVIYGIPLTNVVPECALAGPGDGEVRTPELPLPDAPPGQPPMRPQPRHTISRWTLENGLPANKIRSLLQTRDGYLWIGNVHALVRFDGVRFTTFDPENTPELRGHRSIGRCLYEDPDGRLWIGTENGLLCRAADRFVTFAGELELRDEKLHAIAGRRAGELWIGAERGLARWDGHQVQWIELPGIHRVLSLAAAPDGTLWIGSPGAVTRYDPQTRRVLRTLAHSDLGWRAATVDVYGLLLDRRQRLWISSTHGIALLDTPDAPPIRLEGSVLHSSAGLAENAMGHVLVARGSETGHHLGSLMRLVENEGRIVATPVGPMLGPKSCVWVDREGAIWAGGRDGLARFRAPPFATLALDGLGGSGLRSLFEDETGALWLGGSLYFGRWSGHELTFLDTQQLFNARTRPLSHPLVFAESPDRVWASHSGGGLFRLPTAASHPAAGHPLARRFPDLGELRALQTSRSGAVWLGTSNRLFASTRSTRVEPVAPFEFPGILALAEAPAPTSGSEPGKVCSTSTPPAASKPRPAIPASPTPP